MGNQTSQTYVPIDARMFFTTTLSTMMVELGLSFETLPKAEVYRTIAMCTADYEDGYAEFLEWVTEDRKTATLNALRRNVANMRHMR